MLPRVVLPAGGRPAYESLSRAEVFRRALSSPLRPSAIPTARAARVGTGLQRTAAGKLTQCVRDSVSPKRSLPLAIGRDALWRWWARQASKPAALLWRPQTAARPQRYRFRSANSAGAPATQEQTYLAPAEPRRTNFFVLRIDRRCAELLTACVCVPLAPPVFFLNSRRTALAEPAAH